MLIPWFGLAIFVLELLVRVFQFLWLHQHHQLPQGVWAQLPWILGADLGAALLVSLVLDTLLPWLRQKTAPVFQRVWTFLQWSGFVLLLIFLGFTFKFYALFERFFNYGHWTQVDRLSAYWRNILSEADVWALVGAVFLLGLMGLTHVCRKHIPKLAVTQRTRILLVTGLGTCLLLTNLPGHHWPQHQDWRSLDENPLLILSTFLRPDTAPQAPIRHWTKAPAAPGVASKHLAPLPMAQRQNLNVVILLLESMTPEYAGLTRPENRAYLPNLTQLASESLVFPNHYCQEPASLKSLYTLLTGRYSYQTRNWKAFIAQAQSDPSLAERLKTHGYATAFLTSANGRTYSQNNFLRPRFDVLQDMTVLKQQQPKLQLFSDCVDDRALIGALDQYVKDQAGRKFFVLLSPYFPHHPYPIPDLKFKVTPGKTPYQRYQNSLHFTDDLVGKLIAVLNRQGVLDNTLLVVVSDHGEAFHQHPGNYLHSIFLYEENVRTVFMVRQPRLLRPGIDPRLTSHTDIAPTLLDLLGFPDSDFDGMSLLDSATALRPVFFYTAFNDTRLGLREQAWKYILTREHGLEELYDLSTDPGERTNLAPRYPERCARYRKELDALEEKIR